MENVPEQPEQQPSKPQEAKERCPLCMQEVTAGYKVCPNCHKLRPDIYKDKLIYWSATAVFCIVSLLCVHLIRQGTWHQTIREEKEVQLIQGGIRWNVPEYKSAFSFTKMTSSATGPLIVLSSMASLSVCTIYYIRVSKKLGTWVWL